MGQPVHLYSNIACIEKCLAQGLAFVGLCRQSTVISISYLGADGGFSLLRLSFHKRESYQPKSFKSEGQFYLLN